MQGGYDHGPYSSRAHERGYSNEGPPPPVRMMGGPPPVHMGAPMPPPGYFAPPPHARRRSRSPERGFRGAASYAPYPPAHAPPPKLTDPFTIKELVSFDYFRRWYHTLNPGNIDADEATIRMRYDDYEADFNVRTAKDFVSEQQTFPWFTEMYGDSGTEDDDPFEARFACVRIASSADADAAYEAFDAKLTSGYKSEDLTASPDQGHVFVDRHISGAEHAAQPLTDVVFIKSIAPKVPRKDLEDFVAGQVPISFLSISRPNSKLLRSSWIKLQEGANLDEAIKKLDGRILMNERVGEYALHVQAYRPFSTRLSLFPQHNALTQSTKDLKTLAELVQKFESKTSRPSFWNRIEGAFDDDENLPQEHKATQTVDLAVAYLREVYYFDYWTATFHDSSYSLTHLAPGYVRSTPAGEHVDDRRFESWQHQHTEKLSMLLQPLDHLQQLKLKSFEGAVQDLIGAKIKKEDETRYRCGIEDCAKLFKDVPFVEKHIHKRHAAWVDAQKGFLRLLYRYLCDPGRLVLPKTAPTDAHARRLNTPSHPAGRRRSPPGYRRDSGGYYDSPGERGPPRTMYRDLDRPAEPTIELDY